MAMAAVTKSTQGGKADGSNVRLERFSEALDKFLELIDERATKTNFRTALPDIDEKTLEGARKQLVFHLKDAIKVEKDRLVESYALDAKLAELEELTQEADKWNDRHGRSSERPRDAWRPGLDLSTAMSAPSIAVQRETNAALEAELESLLADNRVKQAQLAATLTETETRRQRCCTLLDTLDGAIAELEWAPEQAEELRLLIDGLAAELGPRGLAAQ